MRTNIEHIPAAIFDWLKSSDFSALSAARQAEVLAHISMEEYEELHRVAADLHQFQATKVKTDRRLLKKDLMERFDAQYPQTGRRGPVNIRPLQVWKAAAVFLLVVSGLLSYGLLHGMNAGAPARLTTVDTVYITKEVAAASQKLFDTVFIEREARNERNPVPAPRSRRTEYVHMSAEDGINVVPIGEMNNQANASKKNSVHDDSLVRRYSFVTL
jgi:hypothetical protein